MRTGNISHLSSVTRSCPLLPAGPRTCLPPQVRGQLAHRAHGGPCADDHLLLLLPLHAQGAAVHLRLPPAGRLRGPQLDVAAGTQRGPGRTRGAWPARDEGALALHTTLLRDALPERRSLALWHLLVLPRIRALQRADAKCGERNLAMCSMGVFVGYKPGQGNGGKDAARVT